MIGVKVFKIDAEKTKKKLMQLGVLDFNHTVFRDKENVVFPVTKKVKVGTVVQRSFQKQQKIPVFRELLAKFLTKKELDMIPSSFDVVGDIAILDLPVELKSKKSKIGKAFLLSQPHVKTVVTKKGIHEGEFRLQKTTHLAGVRKKETSLVEFGVHIALDVDKVYYSVRLANERMRIASLVKRRENVLVMFSGCAPYCLLIDKHSEAKAIVGIEKNPVAHKYAEINMAKNKARNIELIKGDVLKIIPRMRRKFDRILMCLPRDNERFLDLVFKIAKSPCVLHFYDFCGQEELEKPLQKIKDTCKKYGWKVVKHKIFVCGNFAPYVHRVCVDAVLKKV